MNKKIIILPVAALVLAGCSSVSTPADQVALHYEGGPIQAKAFSECINTASRDFSTVGDSYFQYPSSQRNWRFSEGGDTETITFTTSDKIEMSVDGVVNFTLNTDCEALRAFHESIGNRYNAAFTGNEAPAGWNSMLDTYLGIPLGTAIDRVAQQYTYDQLYSDPTVKGQWEKQVSELLPELVGRQTEGDQEYFKNFQVTLEKPTPPADVLAALVARQAAVAKADTARIEADAQVTAAQAQIAVEQAEAAKIAERIKVLGVDGYLKEQAINEGLNPFQPTAPLLTTGDQPK